MLTISAPTDAELLLDVADVVRRPRRRSADSFVLHAPLELAARAALLPWCRPGYRDAARERIADIARQFEAFDEPVGEPQHVAFADPPAAAAALRQAVGAGDLDAVDAAAAWLGRHVDGHHLAVLTADTVVPSLAAAAHGSIFLYQLPRVAPRGELPGELLRPLARELARHPDWAITWPRTLVPTPPSVPPTDLATAIAATPRLGTPGSDFIFPLMSQVQRTGVAADLLAGTTTTPPRHAAVTLARIAAQSMLQEPADHAPYGWSHCLTMPQAVLGITHHCADPAFAVAVAATYVVGFRAALGTVDLDAAWAPDPVSTDVATAFADDPARAAAAAWHTDPSRWDAVRADLATRAAVHRDAHLAKYVLACLDAAAADRPAEHLYLAAAASLVAYWTERDGVDPLDAA